MYRSTLFFILFFLPFLVKSQENLPKLFIKCDRCDQTYLRKEINYVDHVRDQALANIQLFIYRNRNANNGNRYSLDFIGNENFKEKNISLNLDTNPKMTRDEIRNELKKKIELGLVYFLIETEISKKININYDSSFLSDEIESSSDRWKNWVFQSSGDAYFENETSRRKSNINLQFDADKVTDKIKLQFDLDYGYKRFVSEKWFASATAEYFEDELKGIERRIAGSGGIGYQFWDNSTGELSADLSVSAVQEKIGFQNETNPALRLGIDYRRLFFADKMGSSNTRFQYRNRRKE